MLPLHMHLGGYPFDAARIVACAVPIAMFALTLRTTVITSCAMCCHDRLRREKFVLRATRPYSFAIALRPSMGPVPTGLWTHQLRPAITWVP